MPKYAPGALQAQAQYQSRKQANRASMVEGISKGLAALAEAFVVGKQREK